jgi:hypothetical protein
MAYRLVLNGKVIWDNAEFAKMLKNGLQGSGKVKGNRQK